MIIKIKHILYLVIPTIILHFIFNFYNLYDVARFDLILHILAGIVYGLIAIFSFQNKNYNKKTFLILIILFSLFGSILWEITELGFLTYFKEYALLLDIYSPTLLESFTDILAGLIGGVIVGFIFYFKAHKSLGTNF